MSNMNSIKELIENLEEKKKNLQNDYKKLQDMFKTSKQNLSKTMNKRENTQQRFTIERMKNAKYETMYFMMDVDDEYNNLLSHSLNIMNLINKQCKNINEYIEFIKKYCEFK